MADLSQLIRTKSALCFQIRFQIQKDLSVNIFIICIVEQSHNSWLYV